MTASAFPYRLAALDLDDTLLGPDKQISAANAAAIRQLRERGVHVVLASGRRHDNVLQFYRQLGLDGFVVSAMGNLVKHGETGEVIHYRALPVDLVAEVAREGAKRGLAMVFYREENIYALEPSEGTRLYESHSGDAPQLRKLEDLLAEAEGANGATAIPIQKVLWINPAGGVEHTLAPEARARYRDQLDVVVTHTAYLEFVAPGVNKAVGLAALCERLGIAPEEVITFGDGDNDVAMVRWAGLGVAMEHGWPSVKMVADMISPPGDPATALARAVAVILKMD